MIVVKIHIFRDFKTDSTKLASVPLPVGHPLTFVSVRKRNFKTSHKTYSVNLILMISLASGFRYHAQPNESISISATRE